MTTTMTTMMIMEMIMKTTTTMMKTIMMMTKMAITMIMMTKMATSRSAAMNSMMFSCFLMSDVLPRVSGLPGFRMLSQNGTKVVQKGQSVVLECTFQTTYFDLFEYPIVWKKKQFNEETQVNMMGNLKEPFLAAKRFQSTFDTQRPRHTFRLTIAEVQSEDIGNYSCEITGPNSVMVATVTNHVVVPAPIDMLILSSRNASGDYHHRHHHRRPQITPVDPSFHQNTPYPLPLPVLSYRENDPGSLWCIAKGGYLPPVLKIKVGSKFRDDYKIARSVSYSGKKGLRSLYYTTFYWLDNFVVSSNDDEGIVECMAMVNNERSQAVTSKLSVTHAPVISCESTTVHLNSTNVCLTCEVRSKPPLSKVYWIVDDNGTELQEGNVLAEYWVLTSDRVDGVTESQLYIKQASLNNFKAYVIRAVNAVGVREKAVQLKRRHVQARVEPPKTKRLQHYRGESANSKFGYSRNFGLGLTPSLGLVLLPSLILVIILTNMAATSEGVQCSTTQYSSSMIRRHSTRSETYNCSEKDGVQFSSQAWRSYAMSEAMLQSLHFRYRING